MPKWTSNSNWNLCKHPRDQVFKEPLGGFTLLEVLVAFSLLAIMLITIIQTQSETVFFLRKTGKIEIARSVVFDELLKAERNFPAVMSLNETGAFPDDHLLPGASWEKRVEVVEFMGLLKVRKLTYKISWENSDGDGGSFESAIFGENL